MPNKSIKNKTKISTILIIKINMCKKRVPFLKHTLKSLNNIFEEIVVSKVRMKEWHSLSIAAIIENKSRLELCDF